MTNSGSPFCNFCNLRHAFCTCGTGYASKYVPTIKGLGCQPLRQVTEEDVRRIVREEIAKSQEPQWKSA
jgi:hypothetical protein